ncbi:MAG: NAD(P)-dependent oxidoreductase [Burkholderiales bacterium]|nr:NAD(P)-dependent oxidoreductase [Burkholderiales bacterium]
MKRRIAIVGASGLVGAALTERLVERGTDEIVALIHSSGSAWRLTRRGLPLQQVDLLDRDALGTTISGCTHVVNCSRGDDKVMFTGLGNLLSAARTARVRRFVHLSSVMVYGDPPHPASINEDAPTLPAARSYGAIKLAQDQMVAKAASAGLSAVTLCPPNIGGPYSYYFNSLVGLLRSGEFALLDDGSAVCNIVDVDNLAHAIIAALDDGPEDGRRLFITDDEPLVWSDLIGALAPIAGISLQDVPRVSREALSAYRPKDRPRASLAKSLKHLISSDVRQAMRKDPLWERIDQGLRATVARLGSATETRMRLSIEGPMRPEKGRRRAGLNYAMCAQQLRGVRHSNARARELLSYQPPHSFSQGIGAYAAWYRAHHGLDTGFADLISKLS